MRLKKIVSRERCFIFLCLFFLSACPKSKPAGQAVIEDYYSLLKKGKYDEAYELLWSYEKNLVPKDNFSKYAADRKTYWSAWKIEFEHEPSDDEWGQVSGVKLVSPDSSQSKYDSRSRRRASSNHIPLKVRALRVGDPLKWQVGPSVEMHLQAEKDWEEEYRVYKELYKEGKKEGQDTSKVEAIMRKMEENEAVRLFGIELVEVQSK